MKPTVIPDDFSWSSARTASSSSSSCSFSLWLFSGEANVNHVSGGKQNMQREHEANRTTGRKDEVVSRDVTYEWKGEKCVRKVVHWT